MATQVVRQHLQKFTQLLPTPIVTLVPNEFQFALTLPEDPIYLSLQPSGPATLELFLLSERPNPPVPAVHTRFVILRENGKTTIAIGEFVGTVVLSGIRLFLFTVEPPQVNAI
jgi:hypothetical protein